MIVLVTSISEPDIVVVLTVVSGGAVVEGV